MAQTEEHVPKVLLVTGGAGFIGSNFCHYLIREHPDLKVICYDLFTYAANPLSLKDLPEDRFKIIVGDVRDEEALIKAITENSVDTIVHMAAESHVDRSIDDPSAFLTTNVNGTFCVLQAARKAWKGDYTGRRLHYVSTDEVFGSLSPTDPLTDETAKYAPRNPYSASKAAADHLVHAWANTYNLPVTMSNCSNNYGPYQFPEKLIPLLTVRALRGDTLPVYGDGMQIRDWLFVDDHCTALDAIIRRGKLRESYNIGAINEQHNIDIVKMVCGILDELRPDPKGPYERLITHIQDRPGHDRRYAIDPHKIMTQLGWKPSVTFREAMKKTVEWYLSHDEWIQSILSGKYQCERLGLSQGTAK